LSVSPACVKNEAVVTPLPLTLRTATRAIQSPSATSSTTVLYTMLSAVQTSAGPVRLLV
jgi:hypothetical protein